MYGTCQSSFRIKPKATENRKGMRITFNLKNQLINVKVHYNNGIPKKIIIETETFEVVSAGLSSLGVPGLPWHTMVFLR